MERLKSFGIKLTVITIITFSIFGIFNHTSMLNLLIISLTATAVTFVGDMFILPKIGNWLAVIGDFVAFSLLYWGLSTVLIENSTPVLISSIAAAYIAALSEAVLHIYINERVFGIIHRHQPFQTADFQTEFAEETDVTDATKDENHQHKTEAMEAAEVEATEAVNKETQVEETYTNETVKKTAYQENDNKDQL